MTNERRRMNIIQEVCKFRKDKLAKQCFDDDCKEIKETKSIQKTVRRGGDGKIKTSEYDTGNIIVECEVHGWRQMMSTFQLDNVHMPERTTVVSNNVPVLSDTTIER